MQLRVQFFKVRIIYAEWSACCSQGSATDRLHAPFNRNISQALNLIPLRRISCIETMLAAMRHNRQREFKESIVDERQAIESFLQKRDEESFCALFKAVYGRVLRYYLLRGTDKMAAEELTQNVLLAVYRRAGEFQDHPSFRGWLFAIARNELLQYWRRNRARIQTVELDQLSDGQAESNVAVAGIVLQRIAAQMNGGRLAVVLRWLTLYVLLRLGLVVLASLLRTAYPDALWASEVSRFA